MPPSRFPCTQCDETFTRRSSLRRHLDHAHNERARRRFQCHYCGKSYASQSYLSRHACTPHTSSTAPTRTRRVVRLAEFEDPTLDYVGTTEPTQDQVLRRNWQSIRRGLRSHTYVDILNCRLFRFDGDQSPGSVWENLLACWNRFRTGAKINCSVGCLLRHVTNGSFRYFHSSSNNAALFPTAQTVVSENQLREVYERYNGVDVREEASQRRPNTAWSLVAVTNVTFYIYKLQDVSRIGSAQDVPDYVKTNRFLWSMIACRKTGQVYLDNLCFFRCLAASHGISEGRLFARTKLSSSCEREVIRLFNQWKFAHSEMNGVTTWDFKGVSLDMLLEMEDFFDITISVYGLREDGTTSVIWASNRKKTNTLNLNLSNNHFSLITDVDGFASAFICRGCEQVFTRRSSLRAHKCKVGDITKLVYDGGVFKASPTIFDRLLFIAGIDVEKNKRFYPFRVTYDIECYLSKDDLPESTDKMTFTSHHELLSISVCSNVPGFTEAVCFVVEKEDQPHKVINLFTSYLLEIAEAAELIMRDQFEEVLEQLDEFCRQRGNLEVSYSKSTGSEYSCSSQKLERLKAELEVYLKTIPIVSFNGQRYDLQVLKSDLILELLRQDACDDDGLRFVIKRSNSLVCVESEHLRFVDITNFIAPGSTYASYLSAFGCAEAKGFFPYEWVDCLSKLTSKQLPPQTAFYSSLTEKSISDEDYAYCKFIWESHKMETFKDFLVWYNNLDVAPFLEAIQKQCEIYEKQGIDLLKTNVSLPGAAVRWMMSLCDKTEVVLDREKWEAWESGDEGSVKSHLHDKLGVFTVCDKYPALHDACKKNMVGGPSIVFHRYHETGKTHIRKNDYGEDAKECGIVQGFDANALYVWCLEQDQPVGRPVIGEYVDDKLTNTVKPSRSGWSKAAHCWLEWVSCSQGVRIRHCNNGGEVSLGSRNMKVDGFNPETRTVYEFLGCYWHGHGCSLDSSMDCAEDQAMKMKFLQEKITYLNHLGFDVVCKWECEWKKLVSSSCSAKRFCELFNSIHYPSWRKLKTKADVVSAVVSGEFYGFVECDVNVPLELKRKFSEMNPIFKNTLVGLDDLSPSMREFAEHNDYMRQPQRMLIGSDKGVEIMIHSRLLQWYLSHGMEVSKIYRVFRYNHSAVYKDFVTEVTNARRKGDADPSLALLASTYKLAGNSVYGKTITNKERHQKIDYTDDATVISQKIRSTHFISLDEMDSGVCEIIQHKRKIKLDVPVIVGFSILQLAKLRMLQFYYDFMDKFVSRRDYQYVEMDTDSAYMALSGELESIIKSGMKEEFYREYDQWFPRPYCSTHKHSFLKAKLGGEHWERLPCCSLVLKSDTRTPGLFKEEFRGSGIIALNSKTYFCWDEKSGDSKHSCKGLNKRSNNLTAEIYKQVLFSKKGFTGHNTGFILKDGQTFTYYQGKTGLSYFYGKRFVCDDGVSTKPINL